MRQAITVSMAQLRVARALLEQMAYQFQAWDHLVERIPDLVVP